MWRVTLLLFLLALTPLSNPAQNVTLWDDHEVRNDWGTFPEVQRPTHHLPLFINATLLPTPLPFFCVGS